MAKPRRCSMLMQSGRHIETRSIITGDTSRAVDSLCFHIAYGSVMQRRGPCANARAALALSSTHFLFFFFFAVNRRINEIKYAGHSTGIYGHVCELIVYTNRV